MATRRDFLQRLLVAGAGLASQAGIAADAEVRRHSGPEEEAPQSMGRQTEPEAERGGVRAPSSKQIEAYVRVNQCGYLPDESKRAVVPASAPVPGGSFCVIDDDVTPEIRYRGELVDFGVGGDTRYGRFERNYIAEFGALRRPGRYRLRLSDGRLSPPFSIAEDVYARLLPLMLRFFDVQQCGECDPALHGACHLDDSIVANGPDRGKPVEVHGGWHDAGDYLKFVETTSYVAAVMLLAYELFPAAFTPQHAGHRAPEILLRARVGLEWLLKMHPSPTEFYYQVGDQGDHNSWRLPEDDCAACTPGWKPRPVFADVGANLAGRTAAALASAARLYRKYDRRFADRCLHTARSAFALGLQNPRVVSTNPPEFYPEDTWADDMEWGAVSLYRATGEQSYLAQALDFSRQAGPAHDTTSVYNTHAIAHTLLASLAPDADAERLVGYLYEDAARVQRYVDNPYELATPYVWGTAEAAAGAALNCLLYERAAGEAARTSWRTLAQRQRDFVLGCNPFGLSCLIGAGTRYPLFPHHQIANIKSMELSGAVVGGPTSLRAFEAEHIPLHNLEFSTQTPGPPPAADSSDEVGVYHDAVQDYVTNEPAIDYTAKFLLLTAFYHPISKETTEDANRAT